MSETNNENQGWYTAFGVGVFVAAVSAPLIPLGLIPIIGYGLYRGSRRLCAGVAKAHRPRAVRAAYHAKLRMLNAAGLDPVELDAARRRAKQQYLSELDGLMK